MACRFGAGPARNTAAEAIDPDVIAFMDDDAEAYSYWIEQLLRVFADPSVVAVGGPPLPLYETGRPSWFPANFDWVFGCAYEGLPSEIAPLRHLIGANMSVRRSALSAVGGFLGSDFDDLNLCMRLSARFGVQSIYYTPYAVRHYVPRERVTWRYFWRRCYIVNREKIRVFRQMVSASNLAAERESVRQLQREGTASAETIDLALGSELLRVHQGRVSFSHESFVRFLAAEALGMGAGDARKLCAALAQPANAALRAAALALDTEERLAHALSTLEDEDVLIAAMVGDLGERCRRAMEEVISDLLDRTRSPRSPQTPSSRPASWGAAAGRLRIPGRDPTAHCCRCSGGRSPAAMLLRA
jgi:hypothetical protein